MTSCMFSACQRLTVVSPYGSRWRRKELRGHFGSGGNTFRARIAAVLVQGLACSPAFAGGTRILHPQPLKLRSDTVRWSMKIKSGSNVSRACAGQRSSLTKSRSSKRRRPDVWMGRPSAISRIPPGVQISRLISGSSLHIGGPSSLEIDVNRQ